MLPVAKHGDDGFTTRDSPNRNRPSHLSIVVPNRAYLGVCAHVRFQLWTPPFVFRSLLFAFASSWMIVGVVPRCYFMGGVECRCSSMSVTTSVLTFRRLLWKTRPSPGEVTRCKADVYIIRILRSHFSHNLSTSNFPTKRHQLQFSIANLNLVATHQNAYFPHLYSS
jgi:hypothetical protein